MSQKHDRCPQRNGSRIRLICGQLFVMYEIRSGHESKNEFRGQGRCHGDPKIVGDTPPSQDASIHQI